MGRRCMIQSPHRAGCIDAAIQPASCSARLEQVGAMAGTVVAADIVMSSAHPAPLVPLQRVPTGTATFL